MPDDAILIIDDEPGVASALRVRLQAHGYTVHQAPNGRRGIAAAETVHPALILLDIQLPDIDGFAVHEELRARPDLRSTPVIFMSANVSDHLLDRALSTRGARFIRKPYESSELVATIGDAIAASRRTSVSGAEA